MAKIVKAKLYQPTSRVEFQSNFLYSASAGIPLGSYILHQDTKSHNALQFDKLRLSIGGDLEAAASLVHSGLKQVDSSISSGFGQMGSQIEGLSSSIKSGFNQVDSRLVFRV
jgi:hypothetical protein